MERAGLQESLPRKGANHIEALIKGGRVITAADGPVADGSS